MSLMSGTRPAAHEPRTASAEASSPPKTRSSARLTTPLRSTDHALPRRARTRIVLSSRGSPRSAESGQAMTEAIIPVTVRASVHAAAASTPATATAKKLITGSSRRIVVRPRGRASAAVTHDHGFARRGEASHRAAPPAVSTTSSPSPIALPGSRIAASRPTARAASSSHGCPCVTRSGHHRDNESPVPCPSRRRWRASSGPGARPFAAEPRREGADSAVIVGS